jgi:hypothetical protein
MRGGVQVRASYRVLMRPPPLPPGHRSDCDRVPVRAVSGHVTCCRREPPQGQCHHAVDPAGAPAQVSGLDVRARVDQPAGAGGRCPLNGVPSTVRWQFVLFMAGRGRCMGRGAAVCCAWLFNARSGLPRPDMVLPAAFVLASSLPPPPSPVRHPPSPILLTPTPIPNQPPHHPCSQLAAESLLTPTEWRAAKSLCRTLLSWQQVDAARAALAAAPLASAAPSAPSSAPAPPPVGGGPPGPPRAPSTTASTTARAGPQGRAPKPRTLFDDVTPPVWATSVKYGRKLPVKAVEGGCGARVV